MDQLQRYAVYYAPRPGDFARAVAEWLGRDAETGVELTQPVLAGVGDPQAITSDPRRYGFHGTIRAPFRLAEGLGEADVRDRVAVLAAGLAPVVCDGLQVEALHGFLALTPLGCEAALLDLASEVVERTDDLRAPLTEAEIARRRPDRLTARQRTLLDRWGYPHVMEEFRFHLTLTDRLETPEPVRAALADHFAPVLPRPFVIEDLCLFGEDKSGRFHLLHRYALTGSSTARSRAMPVSGEASFTTV
jgi:putative phosphonate metabolism protein